jgi:TRAP-type mannitol/chloroaromatic compound transport system substrate-binding protein
MELNVKRKDFIQAAIASTIAGSALAACRNTGTTRSSQALPTLNWQMATSWSLSLGTIFEGTKTFVDQVVALTDGKFKITPRPDGELAPALEVLGFSRRSSLRS